MVNWFVIKSNLFILYYRILTDLLRMIFDLLIEDPFYKNICYACHCLFYFDGACILLYLPFICVMPSLNPERYKSVKFTLL
jgi:hypothetical protein